MAEQRRAPFDFPRMEEEILRAWKAQGIFQQTLKKPAPKGSFVFYEGPPYANGQPGVHHMLSRAYKDAVVRYRTMRGYRVQRRAGWDTHGLPVEMYVEKLLGIKSKREIEETIGVQRFVDECRRNVFLMKADWETFTERMGYWLDFDDAYVTLTPQYVESCWWIFSEIAKRGLLYQDFKVVPLCTRCGTVLSSHEMAQGYKEVTDRSVTVKFKMQNEKGQDTKDETTYILAWTTTPWTLPGNVGLAVGEGIRYLKTAKNAVGERYIVAEDLAEKILGAGGNQVGGEIILGTDLVGKKYQPLFDFLDLGKVAGKQHAYEIVPGGFVSTEEGTGVVHTAVMYGEDDFQLGKEFDLPKRHTVNPDGTFNALVKPWEGKYVKDRATGDAIVSYLREHGELFTTEDTVHEYPHCWRCDTPLLYYAKDSWFFKTTAVKEQLLAANETINWIPSYLKHGRFGEWLTNVVDWAISRERYWGVPLPIWRCERPSMANGQPTTHQRIIGSFDELRKYATEPLPDNFDPHRPGIDAIELTCPDCGGTMRRVPDVADVWFDSGSMPLAQWHYPFEHRDHIDGGKQYPADFISEGIDQTRGWFYTLLAVATLLGRAAPYRNVISLGLVNDAEGKKMSKRLGNLIFPTDLFPRFGSDAVRWYLYTVSQAGDFKNFDLNGVDAVVKKVSLILLNVLSFHNLYAADGGEGTKRQRSSHVLDRWIHAELASLASSVTDALDRFEIFEATRLLQGFIDILSTWYVRRSRDRFKSDDTDTRTAAIHTLHEVLLSVSKLLAPFTPFLAEHLYRSLGGPLPSVHLESWPTVRKGEDHPELRKDMERVRALVEAGHGLRAKAGIRVRQPLAQLLTLGDVLPDAFAELAEEELNIQDLAFTRKLPTAESWIIDAAHGIALDTELTDDLRDEGTIREIIRHVNALRKDANLTPRTLVSITYVTPSSALDALIRTATDRILHAGRATALTQGTAAAGSFTRTVELPMGSLSLSLTPDA